jgi:hypothetical protein
MDFCFSTTNCQGCSLPALGAIMAASRIFRISASETGSSVYSLQSPNSDAGQFQDKLPSKVKAHDPVAALPVNLDRNRLA